MQTEEAGARKSASHVAYTGGSQTLCRFFFNYYGHVLFFFLRKTTKLVQQKST